MAARQVSFNNLYADTVGEIVTEKKVLVLKRIKQTFHLVANESEREQMERVVRVYADSCPVARSIKGSIEIVSEMALTTE